MLRKSISWWPLRSWLDCSYPRVREAVPVSSPDNYSRSNFVLRRRLKIFLSKKSVKIKYFPLNLNLIPSDYARSHSWRINWNILKYLDDFWPIKVWWFRIVRLIVLKLISFLNKSLRSSLKRPHHLQTSPENHFYVIFGRLKPSRPYTLGRQ